MLKGSSLQKESCNWEQVVLADPGPLLRGVYLPASSLLSCAATLTDVVSRKQLLMDRMICEQVGDMGH
jgi:hypothetical protein